MHEALADVTHRHGLKLVDFRSHLKRRCREEYGHAILGKEYFLDHVHSTIPVNRALGRMLFEHLIDAGVARPVPEWNDARAEHLSLQLERSLDEHDHAIARGVLAKVLRWAGKVEESDRLIDAAGDVLSEDAEGCALLGDRFARQGKLDEAITLYRKAISLNPTLQEAYLKLAGLHVEQERLDGAVRVYHEVIRMNPDLASAHYGLGRTLIRLGRHSEAVDHFRRVLRIDPNHPDIHLALGLARIGQQRLEDALAEFHEALRVNPQSTEALAQVGSVYQRLKQVEHAIDYFRKALLTDPNNAGAHNALARSLTDKGDIRGAIEHYRRALHADPDLADAHFYLGVLLHGQGQLVDAIEHYERAVALAPKSPPVYHNLGLAYARLGRFARAVSVLRRGVDSWPGHGGMAMELAWLLATAPHAGLRNGDEAVRLARRACEVPQNQRARCLEILAAAYAETGQFIVAVQTAEQAIESASLAGDTDRARYIRAQLEVYRRAQPFRLKRPSGSER
ncbi:MAG: tetratricopeptide repeat protein [Phycisphaerales bacterium]|nr:MAG: tetratricopeptide repeat protein [Phycisphaerales bacterium]